MNDTGVGTVLGVGLLILVAWYVVIGLVTGALARLVLPGEDPMSWGKTMLFGLGGSLLGGIVSWMFGVPQGFGFVMSIAGAAALIWWFRRRKPGAPPGAPT